LPPVWRDNHSHTLLGNIRLPARGALQSQIKRLCPSISIELLGLVSHLLGRAMHA
jgi:hypothetical protein